MTAAISLIAIFGATGTGKTTFVNDASGGNLTVGHRSHACTQDVGQSPVFQVNGRNVVLFDTPGFDDTHLSDTEVLKRIAGFLAQTYQNGYKLTGIIYLHRITDIRVGGISRRTFNVFRKLCGKDSLSNVLIVTNMWSDPPTQEQLDRETELRDHADFFQPALAQGARMVRRTHKTKKSAHEILSMLVGKEQTIMDIQRELVDEKKELALTGAAQVVEGELRAAIEKHRKEMEQVKAEMEAAIRERDEQTQKDLEEWQAQAKAEDEKRAKELESMRKGFGEEQARWKKEIEEARASREAAEKMRQEIEEARRKQQEADEHNRHQLQQRISQLEQDLANKPSCIIA
ncbi:50S ribosome-binding GTPase [Ceratobasidium sp. AG-Ba]|nr:50S ribosome-binding GTPase [Ceratobasidium sp. AG-Ba]